MAYPIDNLLNPVIRFFIVLLILMVFSACSFKNEIIPTDPAEMMQDIDKGLTIKESRKLAKQLYRKMLENTIDHKIPKASIECTTGRILNIQEILEAETIIISTDAYCAWGKEGLTTDFPEAIEKYRQDFPERSVKIICLLKRMPSDTANPKVLTDLLKEVSPHYENIFIINESEAKKLNLHANPTRLYVNQECVVTHMDMGVSLIEGKLYREIIENLPNPDINE